MNNLREKRVLDTLSAITVLTNGSLPTLFVSTNKDVNAVTRWFSHVACGLTLVNINLPATMKMAVLMIKQDAKPVDMESVYGRHIVAKFHMIADEVLFQDCDDRMIRCDRY